MIIKSLGTIPGKQVDMEGVAGATRQLALGTPDGAPNFSMRVFTLEPGGHTPHHGHAFEHLTYCIAGSGMLVDPDGNEQPFKAGDFAFVQPDEKHQFRADVDGPLQFICVVPTEYE